MLATKKVLSWLFLGVTSIHVGCAANPADYGACKIDCNSPKLGGKEQIIHSPQGINIQCSKAGADMSVALLFNMYSPTTIPPVDSSSGDSSTSGTTTGQSSTSQGLPVAGAAFEPIIVGALNAADTNPENSGDANYSGIKTPKSQWCSDTCGIMKLEFGAVCPPIGGTNTVTVTMHSGGAFTDTPATVTIAGPPQS